MLNTYIVGAFVEQYMELPFRVDAVSEEAAEQFATKNWCLMKIVGKQSIVFDTNAEVQLMFDFYTDPIDEPLEETLEETNE